MIDFLNNYTSNYIFLPIYLVIDTIKELNLEYEKYVKLTYNNNVIINHIQKI